MGITYLPVALNLTGRDVVIIGGGNVGTQKALDFQGCGAKITVISPWASETIHEMARRGELELVLRKYQPGDTGNAFLVMVATDDPEANHAAFAEAQSKGQLCNVCDDPPHCNFIFASKIERGPLTLSIFTHGTSPAFSKRVRRELEKVLGPEYEAMSKLLAAIRPHVAALPGLTQPDRQRIYERIVYSDILYLLAEGDYGLVEERLTGYLSDMVPQAAELAPQIARAGLDAVGEKRRTRDHAAD